jgi:hypothetical protein
MRRRKSDLQEEITRLNKEIDELKASSKATQRHVAYKYLPADARFDRLSTQSKHHQNDRLSCRDGDGARG